MKRRVAILFFLAIFIVFLPIHMKAHEENWKPDKNRSISLFLTMGGDELHIYSDNQWNNVHIQILDLQGIVFYLDNITIQEGKETVIPLPNLPEGNYQVILTRDNQPVSWYLTK